jgi:hypothetical protein
LLFCIRKILVKLRGTQPPGRAAVELGSYQLYGCVLCVSTNSL